MQRRVRNNHYHIRSSLVPNMAFSTCFMHSSFWIAFICHLLMVKSGRRVVFLPIVDQITKDAIVTVTACSSGPRGNWGW